MVPMGLMAAKTKAVFEIKHLFCAHTVFHGEGLKISLFRPIM